MDYNKDKVDDVTLALLYLVVHDVDEWGGRAWKSFDWETMDRLFQKGFISNPASKAKSVSLTNEGMKRSKELFEEHFVQKRLHTNE